MRGFVLHAVAHPPARWRPASRWWSFAAGGNQRRDQQAGKGNRGQLQGVLQRSGAAGRLREWLQGLRATIG